MIESIIKPKWPTAPGWRRVSMAGIPCGLVGGGAEAWANDAVALGVISAVEVASEGHGLPALGPAYHLSISRFGERCSSADALWVLAQFDLADALEDNHVPNGRVRNFWRYVAENLSGHACACVDVEPAIREDKGDFVWRG